MSSSFNAMQVDGRVFVCVGVSINIIIMYLSVLVVFDRNI